MTKIREVAMALGVISLAALSACSMGDDQRSSQVSRPAQQELSPGMVRQVQTSLQQQGLYSGNVDGIWGPATQAAVRTYQQSHGLRADGQIDSPTLSSLNLASDGSAPVSTTQPQQAITSAPAPVETPAPAPVVSPPAN